MYNHRTNHSQLKLYRCPEKSSVKLHLFSLISPFAIEDFVVVCIGRGLKVVAGEKTECLLKVETILLQAIDSIFPFHVSCQQCLLPFDLDCLIKVVKANARGEVKRLQLAAGLECCSTGSLTLWSMPPYIFRILPILIDFNTFCRLM